MQVNIMVTVRVNRSIAVTDLIITRAVSAIAELVVHCRYYFIDQRKLLFWKKLAIHNNNFLVSLSRLLQNRFYAIGSLYDITTMSASVGQIKSAVWSKFIETV